MSSSGALSEILEGRIGGDGDDAIDIGDFSLTPAAGDPIGNPALAEEVTDAFAQRVGMMRRSDFLAVFASRDERKPTPSERPIFRAALERKIQREYLAQIEAYETNRRFRNRIVQNFQYSDLVYNQLTSEP